MDILTYKYGIEDKSIEDLLAYRHSEEFKSLIPSFNDKNFSCYSLSPHQSMSLVFWMYEELGIIGFYFLFLPSPLPIFSDFSCFFFFRAIQSIE